MRNLELKTLAGANERQESKWKVPPNKKGKFLLLLAASVISTFILVSAAHAQPAPQSQAEWNTLGNQLLDLFRSGDFSAIVHRADSVGRTVILKTPGHYLPKACIANALMREEQYHESLDFYEASLKLSLRNLNNYCSAIRLGGEFDRGLTFLQALKEIYPNNDQAIDGSVSDLIFFSTVSRGDDKYLAGDKRGALALYQQARLQYESSLAVMMSPEQQSAFISVFTNGWGEYTYNHAYDAPYGASLRKYLLPTFLKPKIRLCEYSDGATAQQTAVLQVAILIIHNTDFPYVVSNKTLIEQCTLDNSDWERRRKAWIFASDAMEMYSGGKIKINTTYIDLPDVTVTKVDESDWKGLVHVRHLAPSGLVPSQSSLYEGLVNKYDIIIFAWNGGAGAFAFGGGAVQLPGINGLLPARGCIKRMPTDPMNLTHEFLHNLEGRAFQDRVHGPLQPPWDVQAGQYHLTDEIDWYAHILSEIKNPESAKYLHP